MSRLKICCLIIISMIFSLSHLSSQSMISAKGRVTDSSTGEGLPFATITCSSNSSVGVTTDLDGYYELSSEYHCLTWTVAYLGYEENTISIIDNSSQNYDIQLSIASNVIKDIEIIGEKDKYDKSNPAVELIKRVLANRSSNRPGTQKYLEYNQYTAKSLAINNVTKESFNQGLFKKLSFLDQYIDTLDTGNKVLSIYLKENVTNFIYESGKQKNADVINEQKTELDLRFFDQNVEQIIDQLIQEVDVYDNKLLLLNKSFQNPISRGGLAMYRYYIVDTIASPMDTIIHLWTTPNNKMDIGFTGDIYINAEDAAIENVNYTLDKRAQLNFASELQFQQKFKKIEGHWISEQSTFQALFTYMDIGDGLIGRSRTVNTDFNIVYTEPSQAGIQRISPSLSQPKNSDIEFWDKYRKLTDGNEAKTYEMIDSLNANSKFNFIKKVSEAVVTGYIDLDKFEVGSIGSTYSFNPVEGSRLQLGGRTTNQLSKKIQLFGYSAYGFRDKKIKYRLGGLYSFNEDFDRNPVHYINFIFGSDQYALGTTLKTAYERNILTSFVRGENRTFVQSRYYQLNYDKEYESNFRIIGSASHSVQSGRGDLSFDSIDDEGMPIDNQSIGIFSLSSHIRWAPKEKYIQVREKRSPIHSKHPIIQMELQQAIPDVLGSTVSYTKLEMLLFKRVYLSKYGYSDFLFESGKYWGSDIPFHLLFIPAGNQTYFYKHRSYNLMNFFEFVTDRYFSINYRHYFDGYIMNRIPLIKKLGLRSVVTAKVLWGDLSDANNPLRNEKLIQFPDNIGNNDYELGTTPYIEGSVGIANIFKVLRVDLLKRFTYKEASTVPNLFGKKGLAVRIKFESSF